MKSFKLNTLPAGRYWVGDPCYVVPQDKWSDFCNRWFALDKMAGHEDNAYYFQTAYGDGVYWLCGDAKRKSLGVDAGMLSVIPAADVEAWAKICSHSDASLGEFVTIESDCSISHNGKGNFSFGKYSIKTA